MTDPAQVTPIVTGLESDVYQVTVDNLSLILKTRHPDVKQQYEFEAFAYANMAVRGALVPHVMYVDDSSLLMTKLAGREMDDRTELFDNLTLLSSIAADLTCCHSIKLPGFGVATKTKDSFAGTDNTWPDYLNGIGQLLSTLGPTGDLSVSDIQLLNEFWNNTLPSVTLEEGSLVHGDFAMSAIFVDGTTYTGLIDFGDALIGDPLMDLAYFRFKEVTKPYGKGIYSHLVDAYSNATHETVNENRILFYMVYWGIQRLARCPDENLRIKFADKLHMVAELIKTRAEIAA